MKQRRRSKVLFIVNTLMLIMLLAIPVYAYWASKINVTQAGNETDTIQVGEGDEVITTVAVTGSASRALDLVPVGREVEDESVSSISYTFAVEWAGTEDDSATGATADLTVTPTLSGLGEDELALFTTTTEITQNITYGSITNITITVTFTTEPSDVAQYNLIAKKQLTLTVAFNLGEVVPK